MKLVLGTMTFGDQVDIDVGRSMLTHFSRAGYRELDTACQYCEGRSEEMLGLLITPETRDDFFIASKVNPWNDQGMTPEQVHRQVNTILDRLKTSYVDLLYLHAPDPSTPIEKTLESCFQLYQQQKYKALGLSNYASWQVAEIVEICRKNGWPQPTVYQGMYNALTRDVEAELFPCLRHYGMRFYAFNPLAGGLLTGKYRQFDHLPDSGRFVMRPGYRQRYWKKNYFDVLNELTGACERAGISFVEMAFGWLTHHSSLSKNMGDAIILGASKTENLTENLAACHGKPLKQEILDILDHGWAKIMPSCYRYFR